MLAELKAVGDACCMGARIDIASMRRKYPDGARFDRPTDAVEFAQAYCGALLPAFDRHEGSVGLQGAHALFQFIAHLPEDIIAAIEAVPTYRIDVDRAWLEPMTDTYVSLCATVHDVCAHLLGPEAVDDAAIVSQVARFRPQRVLDFGAGAGHFAIALARQAIDVDAVEIDPVKARFLTVRAVLAGVDDRITTRPIAGRGDQYDLVLAVNVLDHLARPAEVLCELSGRVRNEGKLVLQAQFPQDGWHQSDPEQVDRCGRLIWRDFYPLAHAGPAVPWLEVLSPRPRIFDGEGSLRRPQLHPNARIREHPVTHGAGGRVLVTSSFYARPCVLGDEAAHLSTLLDGNHTIVEVAAECAVDLAEATALCEFLHEQRLLFWADAFSDDTAPAASGATRSDGR